MCRRIALFSTAFGSVATGGPCRPEGAAPRGAHAIARVQEAAASGASLENVVVRGLDFRRTPIVWQRIDVRRTVFLGCEFGGLDESQLVARGALVFPAFHHLPYDPYRCGLYTPDELFTSRDAPHGGSLDRRIYQHFVEQGRYAPGVVESFAQRIHDDAIDRALRGYLEAGENSAPRRKVVAILGGHRARRDDPAFQQVALLAWSLARKGYLVSTGGGPGMMEAGNLGAYLAGYGRADVIRAVATLAGAPDGNRAGYDDRAREVLKAYPRGKDSLAIPTWFWGYEPCNLFGFHVAKYFSNAIREEVLLATATGGMVFTPGRRRHHAGDVSSGRPESLQRVWTILPDGVFGHEALPANTKIYDLVKELAKGTRYEKRLMISDDPEELVEFLVKVQGPRS